MPPRKSSVAATAALAAVLSGCASGPAPQGHIVFSRFPMPTKLEENHRRSLVATKGDGSARRTLMETNDKGSFYTVRRLPGGFLIFGHSRGGDSGADIHVVREDGEGLRCIARRAGFEAFLPDAASFRSDWRGVEAWPTYRPEVESTRAPLR